MFFSGSVENASSCRWMKLQMEREIEHAFVYQFFTVGISNGRTCWVLDSASVNLLHPVVLMSNKFVFLSSRFRVCLCLIAFVVFFDHLMFILLATRTITLIISYTPVNWGQDHGHPSLGNALEDQRLASLVPDTERQSSTKSQQCWPQ